MEQEILWEAWRAWQDMGGYDPVPRGVYQLYDREKQRLREEADTPEEGEVQVRRLVERLGI